VEDSRSHSRDNVGFDFFKTVHPHTGFVDVGIRELAARRLFNAADAQLGAVN